MDRIPRIVTLGVLGIVVLGTLAAGAVFARHRRALGTIREQADHNRAEISTIQSADCARPPLGSTTVAGNAWDSYILAFDRHSTLAGESAPGSVPSGTDLEALYTADPFDSARADALLAQFAEPIGLVRSALNRSHACSPFDRNLGFDAPLPSMQAARSLGQLMLLDSRRAEAQGDLVAATIASLEVGFFAQDLERHGSLLCSIVGTSLERSALGRLERLVVSGGLDDRSLGALAGRLDALEAARPSFAAAIRDERLGLVAGLAHIAELGTVTQTAAIGASNPSSPGIADRAHAWLFTPQLADAIVASDAHYRGLEAAAAGPFAPFKERSMRLNAAIESGGNDVLSVVVPAFDAAARNDASARARLRLVLLAAMLERHRRATGTFPAAVSEIATGSFARFLDDPFDGEQIRYRPEGGGVALWSVGADLVDDGATPSDDDDTSGGDIVVRLPARTADAQ